MINKRQIQITEWRSTSLFLLIFPALEASESCGKRLLWHDKNFSSKLFWKLRSFLYGRHYFYCSETAPTRCCNGDLSLSTFLRNVTFQSFWIDTSVIAFAALSPLQTIKLCSTINRKASMCIIYNCCQILHTWCLSFC